MTRFRRILAGFAPWWSWPLIRPILLGIAALSALTAAIAEAMAASPLEIVARFDAPLIRAAEESRSDWLGPALVFVSELAAFEFMAGLFVVLVFWAGLSHDRWDLVVVPAVAGGGAFAISVFVKVLVWRSRPDVLVVPLYDALGPSFPSGHAMRGVAFYFAFAWLCTRDRGRVKRLAAYAAAAILAATVAYGRVYLGVHWPSDVLAGAAVSALWTICCVRVFVRSGPEPFRRAAPARTSPPESAPAP